MQEYLHQLKVVADQLATCSAPIGEEDLILYTFSGLPSVYRPFQTSIHTTAQTSSPPALPYIVGKETTKDAWESLEHRYSSLSRFHVIELKKHLRHVMKGTSTM
ncbi:hypothetical protein MRB53_002466 [Persea americana]|uniref:Uncharacterized protein n=1 Tax=Persea americana TaxID=3435 RepID=A0ACC2MVA2_PERAE|nr:hypothetical protein MRB53_002466 [Persea americana]